MMHFQPNVKTFRKTLIMVVLGLKGVLLLNVTISAVKVTGL
jgi:hypothetical protein